MFEPLIEKVYKPLTHVHSIFNAIQFDPAYRRARNLRSLGSCSIPRELEVQDSILHPNRSLNIAWLRHEAVGRNSISQKKLNVMNILIPRKI